jgi:hypothetical protein
MIESKEGIKNPNCVKEYFFGTNDFTSLAFFRYQTLFHIIYLFQLLSLQAF